MELLGWWTCLIGAIALGEYAPHALALSLGQGGWYVPDTNYLRITFTSLIRYGPPALASWMVIRRSNSGSLSTADRVEQFLKMSLLGWLAMTVLVAILSVVAFAISGPGHGDGLFVLGSGVMAVGGAVVLGVLYLVIPQWGTRLAAAGDRLLARGLESSSGAASRGRADCLGWILPLWVLAWGMVTHNRAVGACLLGGEWTSRRLGWAPVTALSWGRAWGVSTICVVLSLWVLLIIRVLTITLLGRPSAWPGSLLLLSLWLIGVFTNQVLWPYGGHTSMAIQIAFAIVMITLSLVGGVRARRRSMAGGVGGVGQ